MLNDWKTYVFIDSQNLYLWVKSQWRNLDYEKFFRFLKDKYKADKVFMCIWYRAWNESLYAELQQIWFILIFKPTLELKNGVIKWNVDAELVLHSMIQYSNYDKAIIVSGDWDFYCLIEYLEKRQKLGAIIIPNKFWYSSLLKKYEKYFFLISKRLEHKFWKQKKWA